MIQTHMTIKIITNQVNMTCPQRPFSNKEKKWCQRSQQVPLYIRHSNLRI